MKTTKPINSQIEELKKGCGNKSPIHSMIIRANNKTILELEDLENYLIERYYDFYSLSDDEEDEANVFNKGFQKATSQFLEERIDMINKTIRMMNGVLGRLTSHYGNTEDYVKNMIKKLELVKSQLTGEEK